MTAKAEIEAAIDRIAKRELPATIVLRDGSTIEGRIAGRDGTSVQFAGADRGTVELEEIEDVTVLIQTEPPE